MTPRRHTLNEAATLRFAPLREGLQHNIDTGRELGASMAVVTDGRIVVDLWGGYQDRAHCIPWATNTIVNVWSLTKPVTALAALTSVDSGLIELDSSLSDYRPEFADHYQELTTHD